MIILDVCMNEDEAVNKDIKILKGWANLELGSGTKLHNRPQALGIA